MLRILGQRIPGGRPFHIANVSWIVVDHSLPASRVPHLAGPPPSSRQGMVGFLASVSRAAAGRAGHKSPGQGLAPTRPRLPVGSAPAISCPGGGAALRPAAGGADVQCGGPGGPHDGVRGGLRRRRRRNPRRPVHWKAYWTVCNVFHETPKLFFCLWRKEHLAPFLEHLWRFHPMHFIFQPVAKHWPPPPVNATMLNNASLVTIRNLTLSYVCCHDVEALKLPVCCPNCHACAEMDQLTDKHQTGSPATTDVPAPAEFRTDLCGWVPWVGRGAGHFRPPWTGGVGFWNG